MYRVRLHGRGGQGMKTASRILGTALFRLGFEVQDAPRYGAERRGAPIFAYVRAALQPICERGAIARPDLVIVADETLIGIPTAGVLAGVGDDCVLLLNSGDSADQWRTRLALECRVLTLPADVRERAELRFVGATCAGAAARCLGVVPPDVLEQAIREELSEMSAEVIERNLARALDAFDRLADSEGCVREGALISAADYTRPSWIDLAAEPAALSAPDIHAAATSVEVRTGLWRTVRPVIEYERCNRCSWICSNFCPDGAISIESDRTPRIDYDHCKGCMVCAAVCPPHAIATVPEVVAGAEESA